MTKQLNEVKLIEHIMASDDGLYAVSMLKRYCMALCENYRALHSLANTIDGVQSGKELKRLASINPEFKAWIKTKLTIKEYHAITADQQRDMDSRYATLAMELDLPELPYSSVDYV